MAVVKDIENSVLPNVSVILRGELVMTKSLANDDMMNNPTSSYTFILTKKNADLATKLPDMKKFLMEFYGIMQMYPDDVDIRLHPLRSLYFDDKMDEDLNRGDASMMRILDIVALVLLFFAILNYINLTTALAMFRAKEMATRQLLGTKRKAVMLRLIGETIMLCGVSFLMALLLAECIAPYASEVVNYPLSVFHNITPKFTGVFIVAIIVIGAISGILPAIIISSYKPLDVIRGELSSHISGKYGYVMIGLQYAIVCIMLIGCLMFYRQIRGMIEAPLGYNTADMILMDNNFNWEKLKVLRDKLKQEPWVENVGFIKGHPYTFLVKDPWQLKNGTIVSFREFYCDSATIKILGLKLLHDNHIPQSDFGQNLKFYSYFTKSVYPILGIKENSAQPVAFKGGGRFISKGTFADFHYGKILDTEQPPIYIRLVDIDKYYLTHTLIKTTGDHKENLKRLTEIYAEINPGMPFDDTAEYVEDIIYRSYDKQHKVLTIVLTFAIISIVVASLGLLAMSTIYIRQRRRSIAIKRIFGIRPGQIIKELLRPYVIIVGISFVIACPLAYKLIDWWLMDYTFRVPQVWWGYALVGIAAILIAVVTIVGLAVKAARSNPIDSLKI